MQGVTPEALQRLVPELELAEARRVISTVHRDRDVAAPNSGVRRSAREAVVAAGFVPELAIAETVRSALDPFVKFVLETADQRRTKPCDPLEHWALQLVL